MIQILWADDEIDLLKPHIIYLEGKGHAVTPAKSGDEALDLLEENSYDLIFLDENMPGLSGLETLTIIKEKYMNTPVIMITNSEEEKQFKTLVKSHVKETRKKLN